MRSFLILSCVATISISTFTSCSKSNPIVQTTEDPQKRVVAIAAEDKLALLSISQGYNDLGRYVVEGRIKNLLYDDEISSITIKVSLYTTSGTSIDEENATIYRMNPREEETFKTESWPFELGSLTPDPDKTVITMLIEGIIVSYEDRRGESGSDTAGRYDFRWSRWGDSKDTVESKEPGTLTFTIDDGMDETGTTTDVLTFTESIFDTVTVRYRFLGNELWGGGYVFSSSVSDSLKDALRSTLNDRYGISEEVDGNTLWKRNEDTWIVLYPATTESNMLLGYFEESMLYNLTGNYEYNDLPVRVVVPE